MIYQLLKTTPYLSGQVRIDLVTDRIEGDSSVSIDEIHVVPINDSIWYDCPENQIRYKHTDNISSLYKSIQDRFYSTTGDYSLSSKWPNFTQTGIETDTVDHTYQMGLRRTSISRYGKEFSFLLPMWIDENIVDRLSFYISVHPTVDPENILAGKKIELSDRLKKYLSDYMEGIDNDVLYIGIRDRSAYVKGIEASTGATVVKDISNIIDYLVDRERPLIETDNLLCRQLSEHGMIAKQLFNFNFCFNTGDLFSSVLEESLMWNPLNIVVEARLDNEPIEIRDIYTNYTDICSYKISDNPIHSGTYVESMVRQATDDDGNPMFGEDSKPVTEEIRLNVLDYLDDTNCIDLVHKNKMLQSNFHWAFQDNLSYTWNLYNGFSPVFEQDGTVHRIEGRFFGTPDIMSDKYELFRNSLQWISVLDGTNDLIPSSFIGISMVSSTTTLFKPNQFGTCWSNGIKYNISDTLDNGYGSIENSTGIRVNMCIVNSVTTNLDANKIYCAVYRRLQGPSGNEEFTDYVSIIVVLDTDIKDYWGLDNLTYLGVRRMLDANFPEASEEEKTEIFSLLGPVRDGEFRNLFVLADAMQNHITEESQTCKSRDLVKLFLNVLKTVEYPNVVRFHKTVGSRLAPAPSIDKLVESGTMEIKYTTEIEYDKIDSDYTTHMFRYDGKLVPQFIDPYFSVDDEESRSIVWKTVDTGAFNKVYRKIRFGELDKNAQACLNYIARQKYSPDYPSIGYFYIDGSVQDIDKPFIPDEYYGEVCWFNRNLVYLVPIGFSETIECNSDEMTDDKILEVFKNHIKSKGWFKTIDGELADKVIENYIWSMYSHDSDWEYLSDVDISRYLFRITYRLR